MSGGPEFPWHVLSLLHWGNATIAATGPSHVRETRTIIVAGLIALKRRARRGQRHNTLHWLDAHTDLYDFLDWCDSAQGSSAIAVSRGQIGPVLDRYLIHLWGAWE